MYLKPCPTSLSISFGCFKWFDVVSPCVSKSFNRLLYPSSFFCNCDILTADFWFFFSNIDFIRDNCCLSAFDANFKYSLTLSGRIT